ncbi:MAG: hypothetical protein ACJ786_06690 [Catenulispora sp.]
MAVYGTPHPFTTRGSNPAHPLAGRPRRSPWVIILIGWLAIFGWSPEQVLAVLLVLLPTAGELEATA